MRGVWPLAPQKKRLTAPVDKQFKILGFNQPHFAQELFDFNNIKQLRGGSLQNIFKTFRIKLRLMV
jgi:hypothetical protein